MTEKEAGQTAAKMVQRALLQNIVSKNFKKTETGRKTKNTEGEDLSPLSKSRGLFRMQKDNPNELRGIVVKMGKHGFILNNGVNTERRGGIVHRQKPKSTFYRRKSHPFKLKERPFIDEAVINSGAVEFLTDAISQNRADQIIERIIFGIENTNG